MDKKTSSLIENASKLLEEIDVLRYYSIDEYECQEDIDESEFKKFLENGMNCGFEFYLEVDYSVPIDFDSANKKCNSSGFFQDCYSFPFSETAIQLFDKLGYNKAYFDDWVKQYYGKPDYEEVWDGKTLYDKDYLDAGSEKEYQCVWKVFDCFSVDITFD